MRAHRALLLLAAAACAEVGVPAIVVLEPVDGEAVCGSPLVVQVEVSDFELIPVEDGVDQPYGSGHVDVFLNGQSVAMGDQTTYDLTVEEGDVQLRVELVNANHTSLEPYAGQTVYVTVDSDACR